MKSNADRNSFSWPQLNAMQQLGLTSEQVLAPNFGDHTFKAIQAERSKGATVAEAYAKYCELNYNQIEAMQQLGLTREHVLAPNFGYHTIEAIQAEISKGATVADAYAKFCRLSNVQVKAMQQLGLTREHVLAPNFGYHTFNAIQSIQKCSKQLTSEQAFQLVKGISPEAINDVVKHYLDSQKIPYKPITEMDLIRVVVNGGGGFGHQRAAITLMQKIRETGFRGVFDIQCDDKMGQNIYDPHSKQMYVNQKPFVSGKLISMIPGFASVQPDADGIKVVDGLGAIKISSLPHDFTSQPLKLPEVELAVCAADDYTSLDFKEKATQYKAKCYIGLQPTDWFMGRCFTTDSYGFVTDLPNQMTTRLSSKASFLLPDLSRVALSPTEQKILDITQSAGINTQLIYGLNPSTKFNHESNRFEDSRWLGEALEMQRIVEANLLLSQNTKKPTLLLLPQPIALDPSFIATVKGGHKNIHVVSLTQAEFNLAQYNSDDLIIAHTGPLQQVFFDYLMLEGTSLPPVIEGCNSMEICESAGVPFIHGAGKYDHLKQYQVSDKELQDIHTQACLCLETGDRQYLPQLVHYMQGCLTADPQFMAYHQQRRQAYLKRPDAFEVALRSLGIAYQPSLHQEGFFSAPQDNGLVVPTQHRNDPT